MAHRASRLASLFGLFLAIAPVLPAIAQDPPTSEAGKAELAELRVELRLESIRRVVESIASRLDRVSPEKAPLARARAAASSGFALAHLDTGVEPMLEKLFEAELSAGRLLKTDLKVELDLFRAYDTAWKIRGAEPTSFPAARTGFSPPRHAGYLPEVAAIDPTAAHSMHDLHDYLANRFTNAALERIVARGYHVEVHVGTEVEAFADLKNRGWNVVGEVRTPNGTYERLFMAESPQGEVRYVVTGTDGMDRVRHLQSLLRFAGKNGTGIANANVSIVGDVEAMKARNYRALREGLERMGAGGSTAIVGFRASLRNELLERALARRGAEYLRDVLGSNPFEGLVSKLGQDRDGATGAERQKLEKLLEAVKANNKLREGLGRAPAEVFGNVAALKAFQAAEKALVELEKKHGGPTLERLVADGLVRLPGGASAKEATILRTLESGPLRADEIRVTNSEGKVETVRLVHNYYGDAMSDVVRALVDSGHRRIAYFGTAGGTATTARVGDIHVPDKIYDFRNELTSGGVRNAFLDYFLGRETPLGERLKVGTNLGNVFSPAEETMSWLEETRARNVHGVEVENSYVAREVAAHNARAPTDAVKLYTSVIISDLPGTEVTLGNNNGATTHTFEKMVDHYLDALGIKDVEVRAKDAARFPTRPLAATDAAAKALEVADKLVPRNLPKSSFLRDRVLGIISALSGETLEGIDASKKLKARDIPGLSPEARAELTAELERPYTDAEAMTALEKVDAIISKLSAELRAAFPTAEFALRVAGGIERGLFSPVRGLVLEVAGDPAVRALAESLLPALRAAVPGAPAIALGLAGAEAVELKRGEVFASETNTLSREALSRALTRRGANMRGTTVEYAGREHDPTRNASTLYSRFELANTGPIASAEDVRRFAEKVARYGARIERVRSNDPRLAGGQARTIVDAAGNTVILLPSDKPVRRYALIDELTHSIQLDRLRRTMGAGAVAELFRAAEAGDPVSRAKLVEYEIEAKRMVRLTLPPDHPDRALLDREVERLRRVLDPYLEVRNASTGRVDWAKVRAKANEHAQGAGSFILGLFLKDLAKVVYHGDRGEIEAFFDGLATTAFWSEYGLFVVGAEAGTLAYTKYLQRFVKPTFVRGVLKSNVALATGMALPMLVHGHLDARTFAVNFTSLMLSSATVKAGIAGLRWVVPLGNLERYAKLSRVLRVARGVPGWIYAGVETAVVLYFAEEVGGRMNAWLDERKARADVSRSAAAVIAAASAARGPDDPALTEALEGSVSTYVGWRDRALQPALEVSARLNRDLERVGREATVAGTGVSRFNAIASRYGALGSAVERYSGRSDAEVNAAVNAAVTRFEQDREAALRQVYSSGRRASVYDPRRGASNVSDNRPQAYDDEAALYEAAAASARSPEVARVLREYAARTREVRDRERALLDPAMAGRTPPAPTPGAAGVLERETGRTR